MSKVVPIRSDIQPAIKACVDCRFRKGDWCRLSDTTWNYNRGLNGVCGYHAKGFQPKPPKIGVWGHIKRFWLGS